MDLVVEFLFPNAVPRLQCYGAAIHLCFFFFFFFAFVSEIEILSIRFTRPGISAYLYPGGNAYILYRVTEDIVPENVLRLQARAE